MFDLFDLMIRKFFKKNIVCKIWDLIQDNRHLLLSIRRSSLIENVINRNLFLFSRIYIDILSSLPIFWQGICPHHLGLQLYCLSSANTLHQQSIPPPGNTSQTILWFTIEMEMNPFQDLNETSIHKLLCSSFWVDPF